MKLINYALILFLSLLSLTIAQDDDDFEFDDDDFEFDEDEFDLEGIDEFDLEDDDFESLLEEFELQEDEGFEEGEPRAFGIGLSLGTIMPFGQNIKVRYKSGFSIGLDITTPYGLYFGPFEIIFGGEFSYSSLPADITQNEYPNKGELPYKIMNFAGNAKTKILFLDTVVSLSYSPATAASTQLEVGPLGTQISQSGLAIMVDASYKFPVELGPLDLRLRFRAQEILSTPGGLPEETSDLIGFGFMLNYNLK